MPLLELQNVRKHFHRRDGVVPAVDGIDLTLEEGEILGLVGESGCGKSTLSRLIMQLIRPTDGRILLRGEDLTSLPGYQIRKRRLDFQMIFQDPYASLNPRTTVYSALAEAIRCRHGRLSRRAMDERVSTAMERVGLTPNQMRKYPHEFSGGQRQRIAIARALAPEPCLILADEPVSALDVSIQSQILNLLRQLQKDLNLTMIFISHDLSVVHYLAERIAVMRAGKIVEHGPAERVFTAPKHRYTRQLLEAIPRIPTGEACGES